MKRSAKGVAKTVFIYYVLLQVLLIVLKLFGFIDWSMCSVLAMTWIPPVIAGLSMIIIITALIIDDNKVRRNK